ncbi:uncharacterized protein [Nicotiana tomentosiformis]|uniref:uncharacterized protein n=1 Tax=Nicotiana tomentosiformis TaxID=4098 RepID=UPI00388C54B4
MKSIEQSLKNIQGLSGQKSVSYANLCMFPHVHLPIGFKTPKFERYDGNGNPIAHLKRYCNQLRGTGGKEELLMAYFGESLTEIASEWYMDQDISHWHIWDDLDRYFVRQFQYNVDIAPDRNSLTNVKKKASESFREYAIKWRQQAARVKPPMDETEMVSVFLQAQGVDYFQNTMSAMGRPFAEAIKIREMVENGLKTGRNLSQSALRATSQAIQSGSRGLASRKKKEEGAMMASSLRNSRRPQDYSSPPSKAPQHYYPHQDADYAMAPHSYAVMNAQPYTHPQQHYNQNRAPPPRNNPPHQAPYNPRPPQKITSITPIPVNHPGKLTSPTLVNLTPIPVNHPGKLTSPTLTIVTYKGKEVKGEVNEKNQSRKYHNLEELNKTKQKHFPLRKPVTTEEAEEFFRKMKTSEYAIIDELRKAPSQVSLLSLLMSSNEHQKVLLKTLNEAYVPIETTVEQLERMAERVFEVN